MKKDIFWMILGIIAVITILAGTGVAYINISKYSELQNTFQKNNEETITKLMTNKSNNELPTNKWLDEIKSAKDQIDSFFNVLKENMSGLNGDNINSKHSSFFKKIAEETGFDTSHLYDNISNKAEVVFKLTKWLTDSSTKVKDRPLTNFGRWYNDFAKEIIESPSDEKFSAEKEELESLLEFNTDYRKNFNNLYVDLSEAIKNLKLSPGHEGSSQDNNFDIDYKNIIPSLLLSQYLINNIYEFNNVKLKSIYVTSIDPLKLGLIKSTSTTAGKFNLSQLSQQVTLCFCYLQGPPAQYKKSFSCNIEPQGKTTDKGKDTKEKKLFLDSLVSRHWEVTEKLKSAPEKALLPQLSIFPKELGTTIPLVFVFSSNYKNFVNLLKALYKLNEKVEGKKNIFEKLDINITIPIAVTKILFKLNNNISSEHFKFIRKEELYPESKKDEWKIEEEKLKEEAIKTLQDTIDNSFTFLIEILIYLYDPDAIAECWKNIPSSTRESTPELFPDNKNKQQ